MTTPWVHNISPFLIQFTDSIGIRFYGLAYLLGFGLAYYFTDLMAKKGTILLSREQVADFITYVAIGALAGGRVGYVLFYAPELLTSFNAHFSFLGFTTEHFWSALAVWQGGMASHGGMLGVIVGTILFSRKYKIPVMHLIDLCTYGGSLGFFFGRIANFINGELYGREASATLWMAVKFPSEIYVWGVNELEKIRALGPAAQAVGEITTRAGEKLSTTTDQWAAWISNFDAVSQRKVDAFREAIVVATQHHNSAVIEALRPILTPRYPSQLIQSVLEGLIVFLILLWLWRVPRKPGFISGVFGMLYACARIIGEQFRLPDHDIGYQALGLTRGQWLSIAMLAGSAIYFAVAMRRSTKPIGGWGPASPALANQPAASPAKKKGT